MNNSSMKNSKAKVLSRRIFALAAAAVFAAGTLATAVPENFNYDGESKIGSVSAKTKSSNVSQYKYGDDEGETIVFPAAGDDWTTIEISSAEDLTNLAESCRIDTSSANYYVELTQDISLSGTDYEPIPYFAGIFNGCGYTISDLNMDGTNEPIGLFGVIGNGALVENLSVTGNVRPDSECNYVGGIAGKNNGVIYNCEFKGVVTGTDYVGGIAGSNGETGFIIKCTDNGAVRGDSMTGGIAGINNGYIFACENNALINTEESDTAIDVSQLDIDLSLDLGSFSTTGTVSGPMDMGGIAGYSSGYILKCSNNNEVGYPHTGYNAGGIAGRSCGYISASDNSAAVYGRKDVGGIAGQMEPYVTENVMESQYSILQTQFDELDELMQQTQDDAQAAGTTVSNRVDKITDSVSDASDSAYNIAQAHDVDNVSLDDVSADDVKDNLPSEDDVKDSAGKVADDIKDAADSADTDTSADTSKSASDAANDAANEVIEEDQELTDDEKQQLYDSLNEMNTQIQKLNDEARGYSTILDNDIDNVNAKYNEIRDTIYSIGDNNYVPVNVSADNPDIVKLGAMRNCENTGYIEGDINAGGIAGSMAEESSVDPEDEISLQIDTDTRKEYEYCAVVDGCINRGEVYVKRNYCGGIAGRAELGYIQNCESYGNVTAGGSYAGGIAATSEITITGCYVKVKLSGTDNVGGVIGLGMEENASGDSSLVSDCRSLVVITGAEKFYGAIAGSDVGDFENNIFVSEELNGIGTYSIDGEASPVSYEELMEGGDMPDEFSELTLKFTADGTVLKEVEFSYGESFDDDVYPQIPKKKGYAAKWDITELNDLKFDTEVKVIYYNFVSALASEETRSTGREVFYVEGDFSEGQTLEVSQATDNLYVVKSDNSNSVMAYLFSRELDEQWVITIPEDGLETHTVRFLPSGTGKNDPSLYIHGENGWEKVEYEVLGSYLAFDTTQKTVTLAVVNTNPIIVVWACWILGSIVVFVLIIILIRAIKAAKKNKKEKAQAMAADLNGEKNDGSENGQNGVADKDENTGSNGAVSGSGKKTRRRTPGGIIAFRIIFCLMVAVAGWFIYIYANKPSVINNAIAQVVFVRLLHEKDIQCDVTINVKEGSSQTEDESTIWKNSDNGDMLVVNTEGTNLYIEGTKVYFENGAGFEMCGVIPDYDAVIKQLPELFSECGDISKKVDGGTEHVIAVPGAAAKDFVSKLFTVLTGENYTAGDVDIVLLSNNWAVKKVDIDTTVTLENGEEVKLSAELNFAPEKEEECPEIPKAVQEAAAGDTQLYGLTAETLKLLYAFGKFESTDEAYADIRLNATGKLLSLSDELDWYRMRQDDTEINCVSENGVVFYYNEKGACTAKGVSLTGDQQATVDTAKLFDTVYDICLNSPQQVSEEGSELTFVLTLDAAQAESLGEVIAPAVADLDPTFDGATITISVSDGELTGIRIRCNVEADTLFSTKSFSIVMDFVPTQASYGISYDIPEEVIDALGD